MRRVTAQGGAVVVECCPPPNPPANGYLVAGEWSLISPGTELMAIAASANSQAARPLGYSLVGQVVAAGPEAPPLPRGQRVACAGFQWAWHAELVAVPFRMVTPVPDRVASRDAAFTTLGALALHAMRQGQVAIGDRAAVIGLGVVGQVLAQAVLAAGADVLGLDLLAPRRQLAQQLGVERTADGAEQDLNEVVRDWTVGMGADSIFLCTAGGEGVVALACALARDRGRIVIVGTPPLQVPRDPFFAKELTLMIARAYGPGRYDPIYEEQGIDYPPGYVRWTQGRNRVEFLRQLGRGAIRVAPLITHEFSVTDAPLAYQRLRDEAATTMGVLFRYDQPAASGTSDRESAE